MIFCIPVFNTETCSHMWMHKYVPTLYTCVEMNQRTLHAQNCSLHLDTLQERTALFILSTHFETFWKILLFGSTEPMPSLGHLIQTLDMKNTVSSLRASSVKPKDKTPLGHAKLDTGTPWLRGEVKRGR